MFGKAIEWRSEAVAFSGAVVQGVSDCVAPVLSKPFHGCTLRYVLANQTIGVLVRASFPRRVRGCEVDRHTGSAFDLFIPVELRAVIDGDRFE